VRIDSSVGEGTTVTVVLRAAVRAATTEDAASTSRGGGHERVLLVEDETALRAGTARILTDRGYDVVVACDGVEALEIFDREAGSIDVVVTDVAMPRMGGHELANNLAKRNAELPIVFMSGYDSGDIAALGGRVLTKPVSEEVLLRAIQEVMGD
jgi:two-component system, cell cycle sensor histidine kinase and response regulator CckA